MRLHLTHDPVTTEVYGDDGELVKRVQCIRGRVRADGSVRAEMTVSINNLAVLAPDLDLRPGDEFTIAIRDVPAAERGLVLVHAHRDEELPYQEES